MALRAVLLDSVAATRFLVVTSPALVGRRLKRLSGALRPLPNVVCVMRSAADVPADERRALLEWLDETFHWNERYADFQWHAEVVSSDGERLAHVGVVPRTIDVGGRDVDVVLVGGVLTRPQWRRRGLARMALERMEAVVPRHVGARFGLLFCVSHLVPFYARMGWELTYGPLTYEQPDGPRRRRGPVMVKRFSADPFPVGPIDLRGLPV